MKAEVVTCQATNSRLRHNVAEVDRLNDRIERALAYLRDTGHPAERIDRAGRELIGKEDE